LIDAPVEDIAKAARERARQARWLAERLSDAADQARLNAYADELDRQALLLQAAEPKETG
jgi:hypothetical protein